jgi:uncharacterized protein
VSPETTDAVVGMDYHMHLEYHELLCPVVREFADALMDKRIIGHKCPQCGLIYSPPKGYCPICVVPTDKSHEIELAQRGVVTNYTIVTPVQYHGQTEQLDGGGTLSLQDLLDIPVDDVHIGIRVEAVWAPDGERNVDDISNRSWGMAENVIRGWKPTGEPDVPADQLSDNVF